MNKPLIIFLDIDGVLNGGNSGFESIEEYRIEKEKFKKEFGINFLLPDRNILPFINSINRYIDLKGRNSIKAVLSSTWRYSRENIKLLNNMLYKKGLIDDKFIVDITDFKHDCSTSKDRGNQINRWVKTNKPNGFVILDDEFETMIHYGRLYKTNTFEGFQEKDSCKFLHHILKWG